MKSGEVLVLVLLLVVGGAAVFIALQAKKDVPAPTTSQKILGAAVSAATGAARGVTNGVARTGSAVGGYFSNTGGSFTSGVARSITK